MRSLVVLAIVALAGCKASDAPDARVSQPIVPDASAVTAIDARPPDAASAAADAAPAAADAATASPDAPVATPDGAVGPPDAPLPTGPAELLIAEVSPNFDQQHDLVELLVTRSGTASGIKLEKDYPHETVVLAELPDVIVFEGQIVVVHLDPAGTTAAAETQAIDEKHTAHNFDGAWDFLGNGEEIQYSNRVLSLRAADGTVSSAVPFFRSDLVDPDTMPRGFPDDVQGIIDDGLWKETCVPSPCSYASNLAAVTVDWVGVGTNTDPDSPSGASVQRKPGKDEGKASDWKAVPATAPWNSYGAPN